MLFSIHIGSIIEDPIFTDSLGWPNPIERVRQCSPLSRRRPVSLSSQAPESSTARNGNNMRAGRAIGSCIKSRRVTRRKAISISFGPVSNITPTLSIYLPGFPSFRPPVNLVTPGDKKHSPIRVIKILFRPAPCSRWISGQPGKKTSPCVFYFILFIRFFASSSKL